MRITWRKFPKQEGPSSWVATVGHIHWVASVDYNHGQYQWRVHLPGLIKWMGFKKSSKKAKQEAELSIQLWFDKARK